MEFIGKIMIGKLKAGDYFQYDGQVLIHRIHRVVRRAVFYRFNGHEYSCGSSVKVKHYKMTKLNYGCMVDPETKYPVTYTIKQDGTKVFENTFLLGKDLTENQIKELYNKGALAKKFK